MFFLKRVIPSRADGEGPHSRKETHPDTASAIREANADEYADFILGDLRPAARSLAVCAARDDIANARDALTNP